MNPIEHVWNLKRRVNRRPVAPRIEEELRQALHEVWAEITPSDYLESIMSMPDRIQAVIQARGGATRY